MDIKFISPVTPGIINALKISALYFDNIKLQQRTLSAWELPQILR